jgi:hypothetical protein
MRDLKVRILENTGCFLERCTGKYYNMPRDQLISLFLPNYFTYKIVSPDDPADICIFSIQLEDKNLLRKNEINIMICIENCKRWSHYKHYNKYGDYGNNMVDVYCYNHIASMVKTKTSSVSFISIPTIYMRINYYNKIKNYYESLPSLQCPFNKRKFALVINKSNLNHDIYKLLNRLKIYGKIDNISIHNDKILHSSCYNSIELLEVFNQYKFIVCFENSYNDGYVTEKIFNCFLAKVVPIYCGSPIISKFFNINSFINIYPNTIEQMDLSIVKTIRDDESKFNEIINKNKMNESYNDENYMNEMINIISNKLSP